MHVAFQFTVKLFARAVITIKLNDRLRWFMQIGPERLYRHPRKQQPRSIVGYTAKSNLQDDFHIRTVVGRCSAGVKAEIHRFPLSW